MHEPPAVRSGMTNALKMLLVRGTNALGKPFGLDPFPRSFPNPHTHAMNSRRAVFDRIYRGNLWSSSESRSGIGSEQNYAAKYRQRLLALLRTMGAKRIFDAPCGDLNWILPIARQSEFEYLGGDVSAELVRDLEQRYPDVVLRRFDICEDPFPEVDVWHCRDCLFHLSFADIHRALDNFVHSSIPFALITTHKSLMHRNLDVSTGGFRYLDLERRPLSLPSAQIYLRDFRIGRDFPRYVGLWSRETIALALENCR